MLRELSVQNLALIEDVRVELQPGFCAWTGETGAGKSLLLGALGLLLGERGSADLLRAGADELRVTGRFELTSAETRREIEGILGGSARRGRDHPGAAAARQWPQPRLRQRSAGRPRHPQADRQPAGRYPRPARNGIAVAARLPTAIARRLWPSRRAAAQVPDPGGARARAAPPSPHAVGRAPAAPARAGPAALRARGAGSGQP